MLGVTIQIMRSVLILSIAFLLSSCTHRIVLSPSLPLSQPASSCKLQVFDTRPDPETAYIGGGVAVRATFDPPLAAVIRNSACDALIRAALPTEAKFVITDIDCTVTAFGQAKYVVDLRGRLELDHRPPLELRSGNVYLTYDGYAPRGCGKAAESIALGIAASLVMAVQTTSESKPSSTGGR